jgi:hypothetical protein
LLTGGRVTAIVDRWLAFERSNSPEPWLAVFLRISVVIASASISLIFDGRREEGQDIIRWCLADAATANAFAGEFGGSFYKL